MLKAIGDIRMFWAKRLFVASQRAFKELLRFFVLVLVSLLCLLGPVEAQENPDAQGVVTVRIAPPEGATGDRATGDYGGEARSENIIAASVDAYIDAINALLAEEHWAGAAESAGNRKRARAAASAQTDRRAKLDEDAGKIDTTEWFNR